MAKQTFSVGQVLTAAQMTSLQQTAMLGGSASAKTASYTLVAADAGSAISMTSTSATTITVNTSLFAAGDTVHITNLGTGVCTITAGTATVNSSASLALAQYESGFLDFTSTSAAIFVKGATAAAAATSALTKINKTSFSAVASVATDSIFSSTYDNYLILLNFTATNGSNFIYALRSGGTDSTGNYGLQTLQSDDSTVNGARLNSDTINFGVQGSTGYNSIECVLFSPNLAQRTTGFVNSMRENGANNPNNFRNAILVGNNTQFDGIKFIAGAGTITGSFTIYGYEK
jgi:hypothetical protein